MLPGVIGFQGADRMRDESHGRTATQRYRVLRIDDMEVTLSNRHRTDYPVHVHRVVECLLITEGTSILVAGARRVRLQGGDLAIIAPGEPHAGQSPGDREAVFLSVQFPLPAPLKILPGSGWHARIVRGNRGIDAVCAALTDGVPGARDITLAAHAVAAVGQERLLQIASDQHADSAPPWLLKAWKALVDDGEDPDDLTAFAAGLGISVSHFSAVFKKYFGLSPQQLVIALRIDRVRAALPSGLPLAQIADEYGFADQSHLNRHFLRRYPLPPGRFRRRMRLF